MRGALVAALLTTLAACQAAGPASDPKPSGPNCAVSPVIGVSVGIRGPFRWAGGSIAGPTDVHHTGGSKGQLWILRLQQPPRTTVLTAARTDAATRTAFELRLHTAGDGITAHAPVQLPDGSLGYLYAAVPLGAVLYEAGCWRVEAGDGSAVTILVR